MKSIFPFVFILSLIVSCSPSKQASKAQVPVDVDKYTKFTLTTNLSALTPNERKMLPYLIKASDIMNHLFWYEAYGKKEALLGYLKGDAKEYAMINYGPWDRLAGNQSFVKGIADKPLGANFYPSDMSKAEFEQAKLKDGKSPYTFVRRNLDGELYTVPYHSMFEPEVKLAAHYLRKAAEYADDNGLKNYLLKRADALLTDEYYESDIAWMEMKDNTIDIVIGPIENYEDHLYGYKTAHEAYVLVKDKAWSKKLEKYASYLPELQQNLPVSEEYKSETPGTDSDLNAYDVIYYAGDSNAGSKTIAINLPNDEKVQLEKGTRRLQLKNAMRAKYDKILVPIANELVAPQQRKHIQFDAFFANTMFHEVAHGLGVKNTINHQGTVRDALKQHASALEEGKADILGLYMVNQLLQKGELEGDIKDYMVTFMASIFRSVRFGASSAHGKANMIRFNYFQEKQAFTKNEDGTYTVNFEKMEDAMNSLSQLILELQGNGDYTGAENLVKTYGKVPAELQSDLDRLNDEGIPVDVVFNQGMSYLK